MTTPEGDRSILIVGAGGWGTALAVELTRGGDRATLWARSEATAARLRTERRNPVYLPDIELPEGVQPSADLPAALAISDDVIFAVPSQALRAVAERIKPHVRPNQRFLNAAKGIEVATLKRLSEVLVETLAVAPERVAVLSGPNHAEEVGRAIPTASVVASTSLELAQHFQAVLSTSTFRVYTHLDLVGVELAGALKNVVALATGLADGLGFGDNSRAAIITRGLAELRRLGEAFDADPLTFSGLAGMGDLIATCTSRHSRNANAGRRIGAGATLSDVLSSTSMIVEGVPATRAAVALAARMRVEMPISQAVHRVLFEGLTPRDAVAGLMRRDVRSELDILR